MAEASQKREQIKKAANTAVIVASVAIFVTIFSIFSCKLLVSKLAYQNKVIDLQQGALNQLKSDIEANKKLASSYESFINKPTNLIGGATTGTGPNSGDNGKIILDALPSTYDFPELATSLQTLLSNQGVNIDGISGTDEIGTSAPAQASSAPVAIPFTVSVDGQYTNIQNLISAFQRSIRPLQIQTLEISGSENDITLNITAQTFYQPAVKFAITQEAVK